MQNSIWWQWLNRLLMRFLLHNFWICMVYTDFITVKAENQVNQVAHFLPGTGDMSRFSIAENTAVGSPVYQLKGIDPEGSRLKYSISGPVFSVDRDTGVVRLRQDLDRESQDVIEVIISITDEGVYGTEPNTVSIRREIPVRDYNDNPPTFLGRPYLAKVNETFPVGFALEIVPDITVTDGDAGKNAEISMECVQESNICDIFDVNVEKKSHGKYRAQVILRKPLDFETRPNYILNISATDKALENPLTSYATVSITVIDVQDQLPVFINSPYSATVDENTPPGVSIIMIKAIDGDVSLARNIKLSLENETFGYFQLNDVGTLQEGSAVLTTSDVMIDRENPKILENAGVYTFAIRATEQIDESVLSDSTSTTYVTIVINDVDDHIPEFNGKVFNISIPENLAVGMPLPGLSVFVDDLDVGRNSRYTLKLQNIRNSLDTFTVLPSEAQGRTPIVVKVINSSRLDYDIDNIYDKEFSFNIIAEVNNQEVSKVRINIDLIDVNDNSPIFAKSIYHFLIPENLTVNMQIGIIKATDKDSGMFGTITYRIKGFGADYFSTDNKMAGLYVKKQLDYEKQNSYSLFMIAKDGGGRETNCQVLIEVVDVNDNYPQFECLEYTRIIREGASAFEPQFRVRATDIDGPKQGSGKVVYAIVSENSISGNVFRIDNTTGEITLQKIARSMDTERGEYELVISATDFGKPPLTNTTKVNVRVGISSNQRPIFRGHFQNFENVPILGPPSYRVSIPENAPPGYNVTVVAAHDPDGLDDLLRYRLVGANDNFVINENTGLITVSPQAHIDRDSNMDSFEIIVNAIDSSISTPETATTTVYVNIKDVNDELPKFEKSNYIGYTSELMEVGESVIRVKALDKDLNSNLFYSIKGSINTTTKAGISTINDTKNMLKNIFDIDNKTGVIFLNRKLQHDNAAIIIFTIQVKDLNAEVAKDLQVDTTEVTIYVQSHKGTNPVFTNCGWTNANPVINVNVMEEMPIESTLFTLKADDPLLNVSIRNFQLVDPPELENFHIHEWSGEIILKKRLDYEEFDEFQTQLSFRVIAKSFDGHRSTHANVNITIENVNDNSPIFVEQSYHATVLENKRHPYKVIRVHATDKDLVLTERDRRLGYHKISYSLYGEHANLFEINSTTGDIRIASQQIIDREHTPQIHLQIKAEDSPGRPTDSKYSIVDLNINVLDVNDNSPEFDQREYTAVIPENVAVNTFVLQILAKDLDEGPNGEVRYEIVSEGDAFDLLSISESTGEIRTKTELTGRGRAESYLIKIKAYDNGDQIPKGISRSSETTVVLYIGDVSANDGIPYFIQPKIGEFASVTENAPIGAFVFQVKANDPDHPNTASGTLYYQILDDTSDSDAFTIDEYSGLITTNRVLDREQKDLYNIILEVYDDGQPRQSATRILQIMVLDVDDHAPVFKLDLNGDTIVFHLIEEKPEGTIVGNFSAIDEDSGENSLIDYAIIKGNEEGTFIIERHDNIAILKTTKTVDREAVKNFMIIVKCFKLGEGNYSNFDDFYFENDPTHLNVLITVIDIDDNLPIFEHNNFSIGVRTNTPIDTIITTLRVTDIDAEAKPIILSIETLEFIPQFYKRTRKISTSTISTLFSLNNRSGELRVSGSFADYVDGYFELRIRANNSMKAERHVFNNLRIFVVRHKSLLKFVFSHPPSDVQTILGQFQEKVREKFKLLGMDLHILDIQMLARTDHTLDISTANSCFQMFKNGSALSINEMQNIVGSESLKRKLFDIFVEYDVSSVEPCYFRNIQTSAYTMRSPGTWLVIVAALISLAAIITVCTACCLKKKYRKHYKCRLQSSHKTMETYGVTVPTMYLPYCEPIYGPL